MQSHFTVKTYSSLKVVKDQNWRHDKIILKPNSYDSTYEDIILPNEDIGENQFNVVGEFIAILNE